MNNIWVIFELTEGKPSRASLEIMGKAAALASEAGCAAEAVVIGEDTGIAAEQAAAYGASKVYAVDRASVLERDSIVVEKLSGKYAPGVILIGSTAYGRDLAAAVSARLGAGIASECTDIECREDGVHFIRPSYDGLLNTDIVIEGEPKIGTFRRGIFKLGEPDTAASAEIVKEDPDVPDSVMLTSLLGFTPDDDVAKADIENADIIIAGGNGMGSQESFDRLYELARLVGGSVGASRIAVNNGWISHDHQIGITGKTVTPKLYISFGISGAVPHVNGMKNSEYIVAVNTDPDAPIFKVANQCVVKDLNEVLPAMIEKLKEIKG
ncbi:MAG: electron transfer flavoprotein subunit alpha/FixB family protein [Lachnospiraceae bacterium]|nr:electron transfer flavoprotein subunit alpha/FixB family protein [Lachnospiraceae bacterium]